VLDDDSRRFVELQRDSRRRVEIQQIRVRQFLALKNLGTAQSRRTEGRPGGRVPVPCRLLMRVLAVAEIADFL
jgi:hypothetical protein